MYKNKNNTHTAIVGILIVLFSTISNSVIADTSNKISTIKDYLNYLEAPVPKDGAIQIFTNSERIAPLKIDTSPGANYLVKLVSKGSKRPVMTIFIIGGSSVTTKVPLGSYTIKYASGTGQWFGYDILFGKQTQYSKADTAFIFENTGYQITGYTLSLYRVANGNLSTSSINPSEF